MNWLVQIDTERSRVRQNDHPGKLRTTARRIAGIALQQLQPAFTGDLLALVRSASRDPLLPEEVRSAAERLSARLNAEFRSPSADPLGDADCIVTYVKERFELRR